MTFMTFTQTIDQHGDRLRVLALEKQVAFAFAATRSLFRQSSQWLEATCGAAVVQAIAELLRETEAWLRGGSRPSATWVRTITDRCRGLGWEEPDGESELFASHIAIECIECVFVLRDGLLGEDPSAGAYAGERLLNVIDYRLSMIEDVSETLSHLDMRREFQRQSELISMLEQPGPLNLRILEDRAEGEQASA